MTIDFVFSPTEVQQILLMEACRRLNLRQADYQVTQFEALDYDDDELNAENYRLSIEERDILLLPSARDVLDKTVVEEGHV